MFNETENHVNDFVRCYWWTTVIAAGNVTRYEMMWLQACHWSQSIHKPDQYLKLQFWGHLQKSQNRSHVTGQAETSWCWLHADFSLPSMWLVVGAADSLEAPDLLTHLLSICSSAHALILQCSSQLLPDCLVGRVGGIWTSHTALCELFSLSATVISFAQDLPAGQLRKSSFLIVLLKSTNQPHWYSPPVAFCLETKPHLVQLTLRAVVSLLCLLLAPESAQQQDSA